MCIKKLGAVSKAKILDAAWIWTEPHSKRLKLYVDVEKAVLDGKMNVQQRIMAEFVLKNKMCSECIRSESDHSWGAMIQLRQVGINSPLFLHEMNLLSNNIVHSALTTSDH